MESKLRPVGTEFEVEYPPIVGSTDTRGSIIKYRIVAHKIALQFLEDEKGILGEVVEPIETRVVKNERYKED